jgi:hypothetical protein
MICKEFTDFSVLWLLIFIIAPRAQKPILSRFFTRMEAEEEPEEYSIDLTTMTIFERSTICEINM